PAPSGPLRRRADIQELTAELGRANNRLEQAEHMLKSTMQHLGEAETGLEQATVAAELAREADRQGQAAREDAARLVSNLDREHGESETQHQNLVERIVRSEQ